MSINKLIPVTFRDVGNILGQLSKHVMENSFFRNSDNSF